MENDTLFGKPSVTHRLHHTGLACLRYTRCHCSYITHTLSVSPRNSHVRSKKDERCTNPILHRVRLGQRVKREHKQERTSTLAAKRNEYVTHGADTCAVGGLGVLSVMVGLREEQHNVVSVEWITTATRERAGCFLCENHPALSHLDQGRFAVPFRAPASCLSVNLGHSAALCVFSSSWAQWLGSVCVFVSVCGLFSFLSLCLFTLCHWGIPNEVNRRPFACLSLYTDLE